VQPVQRWDDGPPSDLTAYLREISRAPLLTADEEIELARRIEAGRTAGASMGDADAATRARAEDTVRDGAAARLRLVESNLRLVVSIARRFTGRGLMLLDLIQEGNIGLHHAVEKYDWRHGTRFSTYATWWIRQAIHRALMNQARLIRMPVHIHERIGRIARTARDLEQDLERRPTSAELGERLGLSTREVDRLSRATDQPVSIDAPLEWDGCLADDLADPNADDPAETALRHLMTSGLDDAVGRCLDPREAQLVRMRFGLGGRPQASLAETGLALGVTRERAHQIEARALRKLRGSTAFRSQFTDITA
jgi:RNA polymerase primary sigma factor